MTELIWDGKYDAQDRKVAPPRIALPFQTVETVNESAADRDHCGADAAGPGAAGASTPCERLLRVVTTNCSNHAMFWASVSYQQTQRSTECREKLIAKLTVPQPPDTGSGGRPSHTRPFPKTF